MKGVSMLDPTLESQGDARKRRCGRPSVVIFAQVAACAVVFWFLIALLWLRGDTRLSNFIPGGPIFAENLPQGASAEASQLVVGPPTDSVFDNLRNDTQYITTWISAGWTNDFMSYINMLYLAMLTGRVAILPPFAPSHVGIDSGFPFFGDVFDIPRLQRDAGSSLRIVEWRDVKQPNSSTIDTLGCWSIWARVSESKQPLPARMPHVLNLDVSYTPVPTWDRYPEEHPLHVSFWSLAQLGFPARRATALSLQPEPFESPIRKERLPPDERLMCFDFMFYVGAARRYEWEEEWSPAWRFVGQHAHWAPPLDELARQYVVRALGVADDGASWPRYISIHIRRGDFSTFCLPPPGKTCVPPMADYVAAVASLDPEPGTPVLVTSDESDPAWWDEVRALGWAWTDHAAEGTEDKYGKWYPVLIDAVALGNGVGFVGTARSTMSLVAARRVQYWQGGKSAMVAVGPRDP